MGGEMPEENVYALVRASVFLIHVTYSETFVQSDEGIKYAPLMQRYKVRDEDLGHCSETSGTNALDD